MNSNARYPFKWIGLPAINFRAFAGTYMEHCHNTYHEDSSILLRRDIEKPGQLQLMPTPLPSRDGMFSVNSCALTTVRSGDGYGSQVTVKP
ncbi:hypothetical protein PS880_02557 [Pseudomonas fluorescens]|uniref:Plastocyanin-like domain-containing protein n=1 Tax=Pseudomonas fluorescens TaxID=294 RepID=A0A5E7K9J9_PSEFL|nr:hypothetical protein PS880_02557 [Pseudomonas fluorescens]